MRCAYRVHMQRVHTPVALVEQQATLLDQPSPSHNVHALRRATLSLHHLARPDEHGPEDAAELLELLSGHVLEGPHALDELHGLTEGLELPLANDAPIYIRVW